MLLWYRHLLSLRHLMKLFLFTLSALLFLSFTVLAQEGYIEMDGQTFAPPNPQEKAEWTFARFHYTLGEDFGGFRRFERWKADWPKADRQFIRGVKRLTRIETRSTEQIVDANSDDLYDWPWIYVEDPGAWNISDDQAARLREFLLRGGFLMADDTHGDYEWENFMIGIRKIFPDRTVEEVKDKDEIFHVVYDLDDRMQVPGTRYVWGSRSYTVDSARAKWFAIRDDKGRIMVGICHNSDVGDAWEWADSPLYPYPPASFAYRIGINYILYGMTH
jgi:hypothetical protein